jgi:phosphate acetyltransferase
MQLDAAVNARIGRKKAPDSPVAGHANVLILPDLNAANILYKGLEQFAGAAAYGPVLLGFKKPVSDLSRGSSAEDVYGTLAIVAATANEKIN